MPGLDFEQVQRIASLSGRYQVKFESSLNAMTARNNYEYLDILDRAWEALGLARPGGGIVCDIGCASFWYAAAQWAFFAPSELVGVEIEGHRRFKDGRSRIDYASGYVAALPNARFAVADYVSCDLPADVITAWFPFVSPAAVLAWRLPLSILAPERLFARIYHNLSPGGMLVMVNHGLEESSRAQELCSAAELRPLGAFGAPGLLSDHRSSPAVLSCWGRA